MTTELKWPHEHDLDMDGYEGDLFRAMLSGMKLSALGLLTFALPGRRGIPLRRKYSKMAFSHFNGDAPRIEGKHEFTQLVQKVCGKEHAPSSILFTPDQRPTWHDIERVDRLDPTSEIRLCKPIHGSQGRGLYVAKTPQEAIQFAWRAGEPYLVQNFMPPAHREWRVILHRTVDDLKRDAGPSVRVAAIKLGPTVIGDGTSSVHRLVERQPDWSRTDRNKLLIAASDTIIPAAGESVRLVNSGNVSPKLHGFATPDYDELVQMDEFVLNFLAKLESEIGYELATVCFDIATPGYVFYELQIPFGFSYGKSEGTTPAERLARRSFYQSMHLSGRMMRQMRMNRTV